MEAGTLPKMRTSYDHLGYQFTFDRTIKHPVGDENSILGASKSLNFEKQPRNSHKHLFHGTLFYGLDTTKFRQNFG